MNLSEKWIRKVYKQTTETNNKSELTFAGALEICFQELALYWNSVTKKKNISSYENIILPALENHNEKTISEYSKEDFEEAIEKIRKNGYMKKGVRYFYSKVSIRNFEKLIFYVIHFSSCRGLCENVLWGTNFELETPSVQDKLIEKVKLKKSLTVKQEQRLVNLLLSDVNAPGEWVGVLLMLGLGLRNAEACGLNYGDIKCLLEYPSDIVAWIYKTTIPETSTLQSSGKSWNSGRIIPVPSKITEYINKRKQLLQEKINVSNEVVNIDELPIVCKGNLKFQNCQNRATARDISNAARTIFQEIGMQSHQLAFIENELIEGNLNTIINEKDATAYLLRRNYATHLQIMGLEISEIQYLLGHNVEDAYESRNEFVNDGRIHIMTEKLKQRPLLNGVVSNCNKIEMVIDPREEAQITLKANEPLDNLVISVDGNGEIQGDVIVSVYKRRYERTIDVIKKYQRIYS